MMLILVTIWFGASAVFFGMFEASKAIWITLGLEDDAKKRFRYPSLVSLLSLFAAAFTLHFGWWQ